MVNSGLRCDRDGEIDESRLRFVLMKLSCYPPIDDTQSTPHQECDSRRVRLSTRAIMTGRCHPLSVGSQQSQSCPLRVSFDCFL